MISGGGNQKVCLVNLWHGWKGEESGIVIWIKHFQYWERCKTGIILFKCFSETHNICAVYV